MTTDQLTTESAQAPHPTERPMRNLIVVGVDESPAAEAALRFALEEAAAHGAAVEVVTAWQWAPYPGVGAAGVSAVVTFESGAADAERLQSDVVQRVLDGRRYVTELPEMTAVVEQDSPGHALVQRSAGTRMLVVGSGRKGLLTRAVLGSVSEHCVRHAPVPVVVVPPLPVS